MKLEGQQQRLTIYIGESDRHGHTPWHGLAIKLEPQRAWVPAQPVGWGSYTCGTEPPPRTRSKPFALDQESRASSMARLDVRVLGVFSVSVAGEPVDIGTPRQRSVLAHLLIARGPVHLDKLVEQLWGEHPPARAIETLRVYVSRLRKALSSSGVAGPTIDTVAGGYELRRDRLDVDAARFEKLVSEGLEALGAGRFDRADHALRRALGLWRGSALADFQYENFAQAEIDRLEELRAQASWGAVEVALNRGRSQEVLPEVRALVRRYPLRESMWEQLVVALVRSGRTSEAHRAYSEALGVLRQELGVAPQLRRAEAILGTTAATPTLAITTGLPAHPSALVGRRAELRRLLRLLDEGCRLVTITGPGGIGKTRLALEVAYRTRESFPDGVAFVPLQHAHKVAEVVGAVVDALGLGATGPEPEALTKLLAGRDVLIVLDSVEHLIGEVEGFVLDLLTAAPFGPRILVTSRRRLGLDQEWTVPLDGLDNQPRRPREPTDAARLFVAAARRQGVRLSAREPSVGRICQRVEGLPLALVLAAAWLRVLDPASIADQIDDDLSFLTRPAGHIAQEPQSFEAAMRRTWNLLQPDQRRALGRLSVFRGAISPAAAEVAAVDREMLRDLVEWSLLRRGRDARLELHDLVRRFAFARCAEDAREFARVNRTHAGHYLGLVARTTAALGGDEQSEALATIGAELSNVRAAWRWATAHHLDALVDTAVEGLFLFYEMRSRYVEGWEAMNEASDACGPADRLPEQQARLASRVGARRAFFAWRLGRYSEAQAELTQCLAALPHLGDPPTERAFCALVAGMTSVKLGMFDDASALLQDSLTLHESLGNQTGVWDCLENLAEVTLLQGNLDEAEQRYRRSLEASQAAADRRGMAYAHLGLGTVATRRASWPSAADRYLTAHRLFTSLEDRDGVARAQIGNAMAAAGLGHAQMCARQLADALDLARAVGTRPLLHALAVGLIDVLDRFGNHARACELTASLLAEDSLAPALRDRSQEGLDRFAAAVGGELLDRAVLRGGTAALEELVGEAVTEWLCPRGNVIAIARHRSGRR